MGQEILTLSGTPDFTPFGEFMMSPIHYIYITEFVSFRTCLRINDWFVCLDLSDCFVSDLLYLPIHCIYILPNLSVLGLMSVCLLSLYIVPTALSLTCFMYILILCELNENPLITKSGLAVTQQLFIAKLIDVKK